MCTTSILPATQRRGPFTSMISYCAFDAGYRVAIEAKILSELQFCVEKSSNPTNICSVKFDVGEFFSHFIDPMHR